MNFLSTNIKINLIDQYLISREETFINFAKIKSDAWLI